MNNHRSFQRLWDTRHPYSVGGMFLRWQNMVFLKRKHTKKKKKTRSTTSAIKDTSIVLIGKEVQYLSYIPGVKG